ncbi:hypothetical protein H310_05174 [Aphanomyces invadans]|uniref:LNR domain-containing protein n=1 Tax=Aphanomyces invadans TaxID=157072 RepID=A0A024UC03_9STRA|nr:hypothetical protein H310_05174 [Aphanomyces invadans]ETW03809.1 hypothetical protein H310_05174 [Aphanomyces invadans]|eukprot:XP_008868038.1 hypothetical protein H310_05174 [Aphanomyces invadans]
MHTTVMLYLVTLTTVLQTATAADLVTIRVYEPHVASVLYALAGSLHFRESTWWTRPKSYRTPSFVILYCFVSPLILLIRNTQAKTSLVNLADAIVCLTLSCGHPFAAVTIQLVEYILLNPNLGNDNLWSTQTILLTPQLVPSTKIHLATMLALHVGTYLALRRVSESVHHISAALSSMSVKSMSSLFRSRSVRIFQALRLRATNADGKSSHGKHVNLAHEKRIHLQVNLILNFVYCRANARPLFDLSCHCANVDANCVAFGITDPLPLLATATIGSKMLSLQVSRKVMIVFTNMTSWDDSLPPNVNHAWIHVKQLHLVNVSLREVPPALLDLPNLQELDLHNQPPMDGRRPNDTTRSDPLETQRQSSDPSAVGVGGEWCGRRSQRSLDPLLSTPGRSFARGDGKITPSRLGWNAPLLESLILANLPSPVCLTMVSDHYCDLECFTPTCAFDSGDCAEFGITYEPSN